MSPWGLLHFELRAERTGECTKKIRGNVFKTIEDESPWRTCVFLSPRQSFAMLIRMYVVLVKGHRVARILRVVGALAILWPSRN